MAAPNLYKGAGDEFSTTLNGATTDSDLSITLNSSSGLNTTGGILIIDEGVAGKEEVIAYTSYSGAVLTVPSGGRGLSGTSAAAHDSGAVVTDIIVSDHINKMITAFLVEHGDDGVHSTDFTGRVPSGAIYAWATGSAPSGHILCDGSAISRTTYADLFAVIGTTYGAGDASTTFNVPNLEGKTLVGYDSTQTEFDALGETGGAKTHTLLTAEMPTHSHGVTDPGHVHTVRKRTNAAGSSNTGFAEGAETENRDFNTGSNTTGITIDNTGSDTAHNNLQPYITLNYIIKT